MRSLKANTPAVPDWSRLATQGQTLGVDREGMVIRGYVVAQLGYFKSEGRGQFTADSLSKIVALMNASERGLKSRFTHPTLSSDGLGKHLGRAKNGRMDGNKVRADLHLDPSSRNTPHGDLGGYVMDLAESDPDAFSSSLVLQAEKVYHLDDKGRPKVDADGKEIPPVWIPTKLHASDVVDTGDAVDGFLSQLDAEGLPDELPRQATAILDSLFAGLPRDVVASRVESWLGKYLNHRYGPEQCGDPDILRRRLNLKLLDI